MKIFGIGFILALGMAFSLASGSSGEYVVASGACVEECKLNYESCINGGAFEATCKSIFRRCLRRCQ